MLRARLSSGPILWGRTYRKRYQKAEANLSHVGFRMKRKPEQGLQSGFVLYLKPALSRYFAIVAWSIGLRRILKSHQVLQERIL